jgi:hypothetical protein
MMNSNNEIIEEVETNSETITLVARATDEDLAQIRELGRRYGTPYFIEVLRHAVRDAIAHFDCPAHEIAKEKAVGDIGTIHKNKKNL